MKRKPLAKLNSNTLVLGTNYAFSKPNRGGNISEFFSRNFPFESNLTINSTDSSISASSIIEHSVRFFAVSNSPLLPRV